jgi:hypothetical protein
MAGVADLLLHEDRQHTVKLAVFAKQALPVQISR